MELSSEVRPPPAPAKGHQETLKKTPVVRIQEPAKGEDWESVLRCNSPSQALFTFVRSFVVTYGLRTAIPLLFKIVKLLRQGPKGGKNSLTLSDLLLPAAFKTGLGVGGFMGGYKLLLGLLNRQTGPNKSYWNSMIAGGVVGLSLFSLKREDRAMLAIYTLTRLGQSMYNDLKERGTFDVHIGGVHLPKILYYGDVFLHCVVTALVMYIWVTRPEILPKSYYEFIKFAGPLDTTALEALRRNANDVPLDVELITAHCAKRGGVFDPPLTPIPRTIPCTIMHPHTRWCALFWVQAFLGSASRTLPFYAAFLFLPSLALQASRLLRTPLQVIHKAGLSTLWSSVSMAGFVGLYQTVVCIHTNLARSRNSGVIYFLASFVSGWAFMLDRKSRRGELMLYSLPRAVHALYSVLLEKKRLPYIPHFEVALFCLATAGLMHYYQTGGPKVLWPALYHIVRWFLRPSKQIA